MDPEETITITLRDYESFIDDMKWRNALENGGVDNWEWYYESLKSGGYFDEDD